MRANATPSDSARRKPQSSIEHYPKRRSNLNTRVIEGETVVLDRQGGLIHQFNSTASYIWERLDGKTSVKAIASNLAGAFEVDPRSAEKDVKRIVSELQKLNLLHSGIS